ncbi:hypothetical protein Asera_54400 [Actinocatenispora sera]|uniref:DUF3592 domain-containing protein n=1 Tax=Actinocatenispora sera TaxID=390989 RepID=A0A810L9R4_9ACTN|nr:hypothetical protein Asera_54400 [Actinocatenispora sera]
MPYGVPVSRPRINPILAIWLGVLALLVIISGIVGGFQARTYVRGEKVTGTVGYCESHQEYSGGDRHDETTCYGHWATADGTRHDGKIPNAGLADEGHQVTLRALGDRVVSNNVFGALWPFALSLGGLAAVVAILIIRRRVRRLQARESRRDPGGTVRPVSSP